MPKTDLIFLTKRAIKTRQGILLISSNPTEQVTKTEFTSSPVKVVQKKKGSQ